MGAMTILLHSEEQSHRGHAWHHASSPTPILAAQPVRVSDVQALSPVPPVSTDPPRPGQVFTHAALWALVHIYHAVHSRAVHLGLQSLSCLHPACHLQPAFWLYLARRRLHLYCAVRWSCHPSSSPVPAAPTRPAQLLPHRHPARPPLHAIWPTSDTPGRPPLFGPSPQHPVAAHRHSCCTPRPVPTMPLCYPHVLAPSRRFPSMCLAIFCCVYSSHLCLSCAPHPAIPFRSGCSHSSPGHCPHHCPPLFSHYIIIPTSKKSRLVTSSFGLHLALSFSPSSCSLNRISTCPSSNPCGICEVHVVGPPHLPLTGRAPAK